MSKYLDIFNFSDYRIYLKRWIEYTRANSKGTLTQLAEQAKVHTTFLSHVLSGKKNLNLEQATLISEVLLHTKIEREYFFCLIELDKAGSHKLKQYFNEKKSSIETERKRLSSRVGTHHELSNEQRAIFYSSWIYVAIFVACAINDGQSLEEISKRFMLTREKSEEYLSFLTLSGMCVKDDHKYRMGNAVVFVPNSSPFVIKHHTNWRIRAIHKMDTRDDQEMFYSSPMSISKKDFTEIRELLATAVERSLDICRNSDAEEVVCLNIDFFRI